MNRAGLPGRRRRDAAAVGHFFAGGQDGGFDQGIGQIGNLPGDDVDALAANDVAVGNPQCFPPFDPPQRLGHGRAIAGQRGHLGANLVDQRLATDRLAFGHPQQVVAFVVLNQQIAQVLTGGEDLQQHRQRLAVALEERPDRQRAAGRGHETVEIVQRPVGIAGGGQMLGQLVGEVCQQVECQADGGHVHQVGVCSLGIDDSQGAEPRRGFRLIVEVASQLVDLHAANAPSQSSPVARPEKGTAWKR